MNEKDKCGECLGESVWKRVIEESFGGGGGRRGNVSKSEKCGK